MPRDRTTHEQAKLAAEHTPIEVARRIASNRPESHLRDFVYGAIDGCITTFAIVTGAVGAGLSSTVIIILGFANVVADGFSMAVGNYLGTKAEHQLLHHARLTEENHVEVIPDGETEEIREIFRQKGFEGDLLERVVNVVISDRKLWVETMLKEEWGLSLIKRSPLKAAGVTFIAFLLVGLIPLAPFTVYFILGIENNSAFWLSMMMTAATFFGIGALKSRYVAEHWLRAGAETLCMGGGAAVLAYVVGMLLRGLVDA